MASHYRHFGAATRELRCGRRTNTPAASSDYRVLSLEVPLQFGHMLSLRFVHLSGALRLALELRSSLIVLYRPPRTAVSKLGRRSQRPLRI